MAEKYVIRRAAMDDCEALGIIGPAAYAAAYAHIWDDEAAFAEHLGAYGEAAWRQLLKDNAVLVWTAEINAKITGFLTLHLGSDTPAVTQTGGAEVRRIYLLPGSTGCTAPTIIST